MRPFYFIRHGETDWNRAKRLQGATDVPLNDFGISQARISANRFAGIRIDIIVTSPLQRAMQTALILNETIKGKIVVDDRLAERSFGLIEGMTKEEIDSHNEVDLFDLSVPLDIDGLRFPWQAEPAFELVNRAKQAVTDSLEYYSSQNILFCAHGTWFRYFAHDRTQRIFRVENAVPYYCDFNLIDIREL